MECEMDLIAALILVVSLSSGLGYMFGGSAAKHDIASDCSSLGKTRLQDKVLECKFEVTK